MRCFLTPSSFCYDKATKDSGFSTGESTDNGMAVMMDEFETDGGGVEQADEPFMGSARNTHSNGHIVVDMTTPLNQQDQDDSSSVDYEWDEERQKVCYLECCLNYLVQK